MTNYVIDTSALAPWLVTEEYSPNTAALIRQIRPPQELCIPEFGLTECVNVLWKQVRLRGMAQAVAEQLLQDLLKLPLRLMPASPVYEDAFQIGIKYQLAIYDSLYTALAKQLNYPLITLDQKQMQAAAQEHVTVTPLTNFVP